MIALRAIGVVVLIAVFGPLVGLLALILALAGIARLSFLYTTLLGAAGQVLTAATAHGLTVFAQVALAYSVIGKGTLLVGGWIALRTMLRGNVGYVETALAAFVAAMAAAPLPMHSGWRFDDAIGVQDYGVSLCILSALICRWLLDVLEILPALIPASATHASPDPGKS